MEPTSKGKEWLEAKAQQLLQLARQGPTEQAQGEGQAARRELAALAHDLVGSSDDKTTLADWLADKASELWVRACAMACPRRPSRTARSFPPAS